MSVATSCLVEGSPASMVADVPEGGRRTLSVEHPSGEISCVLTLGEDGWVARVALLRTARKLIDGMVFGETVPDPI